MRYSASSPEVAADEEGADRLGHATGAGNQFGDRRAELDLVDAGPGDGSRERDERGSRLDLRAQRTEPGGAVAGDESKLCKRLGVLHERRRAAEAALERDAAA